MLQDRLPFPLQSLRCAVGISYPHLFECYAMPTWTLLEFEYNWNNIATHRCKAILCYIFGESFLDWYNIVIIHTNLQHFEMKIYIRNCCDARKVFIKDLDILLFRLFTIHQQFYSNISLSEFSSFHIKLVIRVFNILLRYVIF